MTSYWCELAWLGGTDAESAVLIEVEGAAITGITTGVVSSPDHAVRLAGLTMPGFANAHSHAFHRALRGRTHHGSGSFWTWREQMYALASVLDPDGCFRLARATFAEMVMAGFTTVGEFHYIHHGPDGRPYASPNAMGEAIAAAAAEAGIRLTLIDTCYLHAGIGREPEGVQRRFADRDVEAWVQRVDALAAAEGERADGPGFRVGAAVHSVRACGPDEIAAVATWTAAEGRVLHAHVSEQPAENEQCLAAYSMTPTALLDSRGALSLRSTLVHATHVTDHDRQLIVRSGATTCLCPTTERDLADGTGRASLLIGQAAEDHLSARLAIGSDSHAVIDPFEDSRAIELDERLVTNVRGNVAVTDLLEAATVGGHRALGWTDVGRLAVGAAADLVTVSFESMRLAGTRERDALAGVVFSATAADIDHVVVGGRVVVSGGRHRTIDGPGELRAVLAGLP